MCSCVTKLPHLQSYDSSSLLIFPNQRYSCLPLLKHVLCGNATNALVDLPAYVHVFICVSEPVRSYRDDLSMDTLESTRFRKLCIRVWTSSRQISQSVKQRRARRRNLSSHFQLVPTPPLMTLANAQRRLLPVYKMIWSF